MICVSFCCTANFSFTLFDNFLIIFLKIWLDSVMRNVHKFVRVDCEVLIFGVSVLSTICSGFSGVSRCLSNYLILVLWDWSVTLMTFLQYFHYCFRCDTKIVVATNRNYIQLMCNCFNWKRKLVLEMILLRKFLGDAFFGWLYTHSWIRLEVPVD